MRWNVPNRVQSEKLKKQKSIANFVDKWSKVESSVKKASGIEDKTSSFTKALEVLIDIGSLAATTINKLFKLRDFRNQVVHEPNSVELKELDKSLKDLSSVSKEAEAWLMAQPSPLQLTSEIRFSSSRRTKILITSPQRGLSSSYSKSSGSSDPKLSGFSYRSMICSRYILSSIFKFLVRTVLHH